MKHLIYIAPILAALAFSVSCNETVSIPQFDQTVQAPVGDIRALYVEVGHNMWCDYPTEQMLKGRTPEEAAALLPEDKRPDFTMRCDDGQYRKVVDYAVSKGVNMIVLDLGEDHDDDWWEYYTTAQFDAYRAEQTKLLTELRDNEYFDGVFNMVVCHIPISFINSRRNHETVKNAWTRTLNGTNIDIAVYGHQHDLTVFAPGEDVVVPFKPLTYNPNFIGEEGRIYKGYLAETNFYGFMAGRAALDQTSEPRMFTTKEFTGLSVFVRPMDGGMTRGFFVNAAWMNSRHEAVPVCNMFGTDEPEDVFVYQKKR